MSFLLPLIALALAALCRFTLREPQPPSKRFDGPRALALLLLVIVGAVAISRYGPEIDRSGLITGLAIGAAVALLGELVGGSVAPIAIGVAGASAMHLLRETTVPSAQLALLGGVGLGALAFGVDGALLASVAASLCTVADYLGAKHADTAGAGYVGSEIGLAIAAGALVAWWLPQRLTALKAVVVGLVTVAVAFFATRAIESSLVVATGVGALAGVVIHWLLPDDEAEPVRVGLATVISIGVATIAFGLSRGAGMALALIAAAGVLLAVGNRRAILTLGPLVGLVLYRVLREAGTGATRALDIGQHYSLLGLALGAILPLLPADWQREGARGAAGRLLWGLLVLATPPLVILMFGMRGAVGFVVGLGFASLWQTLRQSRTLLPMALAAGMAGTTILVLGWLSDVDELTRDEKIHMFSIAGGAILVIALLLALISRPVKGAPVGGEVAR